MRPEDDGFFLEPARQHNVQEEKHIGMAKAQLYQATEEELDEGMSHVAELYKNRDARLSTLRQLSNPFPEPPSGRQRVIRGCPSLYQQYPDCLMPLPKFRAAIQEAIKGRGWKVVRSTLRVQLLRCEWPNDILRVVAVAMQHDQVGHQLACLYEPIMRALYQCRSNVTDPVVLKTLNIVIERFRMADLHIEPNLVFMALKFAARARSLPKMKKYLKLVRESGLKMTSNVYRSIIAKFSIGHRGLGEIRNGRWRRSELRQVLLGFDDTKDLPPEKQYHLGSFLVRDDWQSLHGWVAVLARCKESEEVWKEWLHWKKSAAFHKPSTLVIRDPRDNTPDVIAPFTNKMRGLCWFLEQITYAGDIAKAWQILEESGIEFRKLKRRIADKLLEAVEHAPRWNEDIRIALLEKYGRDLDKIEKALGVRWVAGAEDGDGHHELFMDQEEALDKLGEEGWVLDDDYGYPWDTSPLVPEREKSLHNA